MQNLGVGTWIHRRRVKSAGKTAVISGPSGDVALTYDAMAERIDRLASALGARGVVGGDRVAYLGANSPEFLEVLFAAGTLGAVFVPLNTRLAAPEIAFALEDSGASILVYDPDCAPSIASASTPLLAVGPDYEAAIADGSPEHVDVPVSLDDAALILYTSGTTGRPKGAILTHGNMTWNALNVLVDYDVTSREIGLMMAPMFHVASLGMGAMPALLKGATLVLHAKFDAGATLAAIERHGVTSLSGVPTTFQLLSEHPAWATTDLGSLVKLTCGGSAIPARVVTAFEERGLGFSSGYGMTETAPGATSLSVEHAVEKPGSSGLPHFFTDVRIVDESGQDAAAGELGEIWVSGPNVTAGYWNRPDATAEAIVDGWFHTGDLGYRDDEGFVTVTDRLKDMIISGGENIYPAELEQLIMELDAVESVAVVGVPDERWGEVGVAVVVVADGREIDADSILTHLDGRVARYKIPKSVVFTDVLPVTGSGKPKKAELRARFSSGI